MAITSNGVTQWKFQRAANLLTVIAGSILICLLFCSSVSSHADLVNLLSTTWVQVFFAISLVVLALNSVLAGWQIGGDYAKKVKLPVSVFVVITAVVSLVYVVCGLGLLF